MSANQLVKVPQLKPGSTVTVPLGSGFIAKIQECYMHHIQGHEEDVKKLQEKNGQYDKEPLTIWENTALTYSTLLQEIMRIAEANKQIEYVEMDIMQMIPNGGSVPQADATPKSPLQDLDLH